MKCLACFSENSDPKAFKYTPTTIDKLKIFDNRKILCCKNCGFGMIEKDVDEEMLKRYYSSDYSGKARKKIHTKAVTIDIRTSFSFDVRSLSQLNLIRQYIDFNSELTVLEIGSGTGDFLFSLRQMNFTGKYVAFEPQDQAHKCLEELGANIEKDIFDLKGAQKYKNSVDLVIMSHSLEHFNPGKISEITSAVHTMLRVGGIFFCEVPNADIVKYPNAGEKVVPHLSFFSEDSIKNFVQKADMDLLFINACGNNQFDKDEDLKIRELEKIGHFVFDLDEKNGILRNQSYHRYLESERKRLLKKNKLLNIAFKSIGKKTMMMMINLLRKYRQNSYNLFLGSSYFQYGHDREFLRVIAIKRTI
jgi:SAM-dependent methyltransferase